MSAKYVVFEINGLEQMIIFAESLTHRTIANRFMIYKPISAGFINVGIRLDGDVIITASGKSTSLKLNSREVDNFIAQQLLKGY